jgi:methyl halide transferase
MGVLICVEWPSTKDPKAGGPPWALPPYVYTAHLPRPGQKLAYSENDVLLEENIGSEAKDGLRRVAHFHPKKTHNAGIADGSVTDYVGVWKHKSIA